MTSPQNIENWLKQQELEETESAQRRRRVYLQQRRLGDWLARIEESEEVPDLDQIDSVFLLVWHKEKPLVVRKGDAFVPWELPILDRAAEPALFVDDSQGPKSKSAEKRLDRWLKGVAQERWGIGVRDWYQWGFQRLTATTEAPDVAPGSERFDLFLCATASKLEELPEEGEWARRYSSTRDFNKLLRDQYLEFEMTLMEAHSSYLIRLAQAANAGS